MEETLERIYTVPLRAIKSSPRNGRADRAVRAVRSFLIRHMKAEEVWIDAGINEFIWARGKFKIPSKIRIRARLFDDGVCEASLPEGEGAAGGASIRESRAEARDQKLEERETTDDEEEDDKKPEPTTETQAPAAKDKAPKAPAAKPAPKKPAPSKSAAQKATPAKKKSAPAKKKAASAKPKKDAKGEAS